LTCFIEAGFLADAQKEQKLREIVNGYVDLLLFVKTKEELAQLNHVTDAISTVRPWLRKPAPS